MPSPTLPVWHLQQRDTGLHLLQWEGLLQAVRSLPWWKCLQVCGTAAKLGCAMVKWISFFAGSTVGKEILTPVTVRGGKAGNVSVPQRRFQLKHPESSRWRIGQRSRITQQTVFFLSLHLKKNKRLASEDEKIICLSPCLCGSPDLMLTIWQVIVTH